MRVLGVDPGSSRTGWGLLEGPPQRPGLVASGVVRLPRSVAFAQRLFRLHREFEDLVSRLEPDAACVETLFHGVNTRSVLQLSHARGVLLAVLAGAGVAITEYAPAHVKKALTGTGRADKEQVRRMLRTLLGDALEGASLDASDALALAYCHLTSASTEAAVRRALERSR